MPNPTGLEILRLLKMRWDAPGEGGKSSLVDLNELSEHFGLPHLEMRDQCTLLETEHYIEGSHSLGGDPNPSYFITDWGKRYVIENS